jgi:hypothetical protein
MFTSTVLEAEKSKIIAGEDPLSGWHMATFFYAHIAERRKRTSCDVFFFPYKELNPMRRALPSWPYLILITSQRPYLLISSHLRLVLHI